MPYAICFIKFSFRPILRQKEIRRKLEKLAKIVGLKISRNENFITQMAYGDKKIFYNFFKFIIEKI